MLDTAHPGAKELLRRRVHGRGEEILSGAPATGACSVMGCRYAVHVVRPARRVMVEVVAPHHVTGVSGGSAGEIVVPAKCSKPVLVPLAVVEAKDRLHQVRDVLRGAARAGATTCCGLRRKAAMTACEGRRSSCQGQGDCAECDCEKAFCLHTAWIAASSHREHPPARGSGGRICASPRRGPASPNWGASRAQSERSGGRACYGFGAGDAPAKPEACNPSRTTADSARTGRRSQP
jgi:hypothetical protein